MKQEELEKKVREVRAELKIAREDYDTKWAIAREAEKKVDRIQSHLTQLEVDAFGGPI